MKQYINSIFTLLILLFSLVVTGQASLNMTRVYWYDDNSLPVQDDCAYNDCWGYVDPSGNEYAIIGTLQKVMIFNVTDPASAHLVAQFTPGGTTYWRDFATYGHYLYAVSEATGNGLQVYDLSGLPATVTQVGQYVNNFSKAHTITADPVTGKLYVSGANTRTNGVIVLNAAANGANPPLCSSVALPGQYLHDVYVENNIAYAHHLNNRFYIYNFANCTAPTTLGSLLTYHSAGLCHSGWLGPGNQYVLTDETHNASVKLLNVADPTDINVLGTFKSTLLGPAQTNSIAHNAFIHNGKAFVAYYHDGLQVFSLANPSNITRVGYFDTDPFHSTYSGYYGAWSCYPFLPSGRIIVSDQLTGLSLLELASAPALPLQWREFSGRPVGSAVELTWETEQEVNTASFIVERSANGQAFAPLRELPAGDENARNTYTCLDPNPHSGTNYYRLKQVDRDGQFSYSKIISVTVEGQAAAPFVRVAPQPFDGRQLQLFLSENPSTTLTAELHDAAGRLLERQTWPTGSGGALTWTLETPLAAGIYFMTIYRENVLVEAVRVGCRGGL